MANDDALKSAKKLLKKEQKTMKKSQKGHEKTVEQAKDKADGKK
jgi:hypothetical protein